jgi:hypothetical protein
MTSIGPMSSLIEPSEKSISCNLQAFSVAVIRRNEDACACDDVQVDHGKRN